MKKIYIIIIGLIFIVPVESIGQIFYSGTLPGEVNLKKEQNEYIFKNNVLQATFSFSENTLASIDFENEITRQHSFFGSSHIFSMTLSNGMTLNNNDFIIQTAPSIKTVAGNSHAIKLSEKDAGECIVASFYNEKYKITVQWQAMLRNNSNYVQQIFSFKESEDSPVIDKLYLINLPASAEVEKSGRVDGSPLVVHTDFFAIENPMSKVDSTSIYINRAAALSNTDSAFQVSTVYGVTPENQLRRGFLYYLERERAEPYRQFLHYNSWFDLSFDTLRLNEADCLDRIQTWSDSLTVERGIKLDGYLWDDGWDDYNTLWQFFYYEEKVLFCS